MSTTIKYFCSWWGSDHLSTGELLEQIAAAGYDGVEIGIPESAAAQDELINTASVLGLQVIAHQYAFPEVDFLSFIERYRANLIRSAEFSPLKINSHTGSDFWTFEQNCLLVDIAEDISRQSGIEILHETHRGRFLYSAAASRPYFDRYPDMRVTFDLGHWTCVSGNLLEFQDDMIEEAIHRASHIHARVAFADGPQVLDPFHSVWARESDVFTCWWREIVRRHEARGARECTITLEAGPVLSSDRISDLPAPDFWASNLRMRDHLQSAFEGSSMPSCGDAPASV